MPFDAADKPFYHIKAQTDWEDDLVECYDLTEHDEWTRLQDYYLVGTHGTSMDRQLPWRRCLAVLRVNDAKTAIVEKRYVDRDFRSEYSALYSQILAPVADTTHRIHFFRSAHKGFDLQAAILERSVHEQLSDNYLGYIICRPSPLEIVGRTLILPPPRLSVRTPVREEVNFFGISLVAEGVPFMQQDSRLGVCAHVAAWILLYSAYRCGDTGKLTIADVVRMSTGVLDGRLGLQDDDVIRTLQTAGLRPQMYQREDDLPQQRGYPWSPPPSVEASQERINADFKKRFAENIIPCLNSGIPAYVAAAYHAFVVCGYTARSHDHSLVGNVVYTVHDDQVGPYIQVKSPVEDYRFDRLAQIPALSLTKQDCVDALSPDLSAEVDRKTRRYAERYPEVEDVDDTRLKSDLRDWETVILPLPKNVHLSFDAAERYALARFDEFVGKLELAKLADLEIAPGVMINLSLELGKETLSVRTYVADSKWYKQSLSIRGIHAAVAVEYRRARLAANVHVVELLYRPSGIAQTSVVIGEVVLDSTSGDKHPWEHCFRLGHRLAVTNSNGTRRTGSFPFSPAVSGFPGSRHMTGRSTSGQSR